MHGEGSQLSVFFFWRCYQLQCLSFKATWSIQKCARGPCTIDPPPVKMSGFWQFFKSAYQKGTTQEWTIRLFDHHTTSLARVYEHFDQPQSIWGCPGVNPESAIPLIEPPLGPISEGAHGGGAIFKSLTMLATFPFLPILNTLGASKKPFGNHLDSSRGGCTIDPLGGSQKATLVPWDPPGSVAEMKS